MSITNITFSDNFSTWKDRFNEAVNKLNAATSSATANTIVQRDTAGSIQVVSVTETSTIDVKENIRPLDYGLKINKKFNPVVYDFKEKFSKNGEKNVPGLIAEEVIEFYPELVKKDESNNIVGINYTKIISILISAVQELEEQNVKMENRISELEKKTDNNSNSSELSFLSLFKK
tara:strand:- start:3 stop:527 length:525 start_codon:yes stop_codon:yes gene_type:complete